MMRNGLGKLMVAGSLLTAAAVWAPTAAQAVPITYEFSGTVNYVSSSLSGAAAIGDIFSGSFTYESSTTPDFQDSSRSYYLGVVSNLHFTVGSFSGDNTYWPQFDVGQNSILVENSFNDRIYLQQAVSGLSLNGFSPAGFLFHMVDRDGSTLSSTALPTTLTIPVRPVILQVGLSLFDDSTGSVTSSIYGNVTSLTRVSSVPEPSSLLLLGSGLAGCIFWRRKLVA